MVTLKNIQDFLSGDKIAIAGVSRKKMKYGRIVYNELKNKGYNVIPINPNMDMVDNEKCFHDVSSLPGDVKHLLIVTPSKKTEAIVKQAIEKGINQIWIQQKSDTKEAIELAKQNNINIVSKKCIMMFAEPVKGGHKFHKTINKIFGLLPK